MTKLKKPSQLPKFTKQKHDSLLIILLAVLSIGLLFGFATMYRRSVLENQSLKEQVNQSTMIWQMDESCAEQIENNAKGEKVIILKIK